MSTDKQNSLPLSGESSDAGALLRTRLVPQNTEEEAPAGPGRLSFYKEMLFPLVTPRLLTSPLN